MLKRSINIYLCCTICIYIYDIRVRPRRSITSLTPVKHNLKNHLKYIRRLNQTDSWAEDIYIPELYAVYPADVVEKSGNKTKYTLCGISASGLFVIVLCSTCVCSGGVECAHLASMLPICKICTNAHLNLLDWEMKCVCVYMVCANYICICVRKSSILVGVHWEKRKTIGMI